MGQVHAPATFRYLLWGSSNINLDITLSPDLLKKKECKGFNLSHSPGVKLTQCSPFTSYDQMKIYVKINEIHFKVILTLDLNCRWGVTSALTLRFGTWEISENQSERSTLPQPVITSLKLTMETEEQGVKYV